MPPLLAPAIAAIAAGAGVTLSATAVSAIAYGITAIATIGAQFAFNRLSAKRGKKGDPQLTSFTIRQPIPVRTRAYGQVKLSGALFYEDAIPLQFQPLLLGVVFCEGPVEAFTAFYLNESNTGITGSGGSNLALPWGTLVIIEGKLGTDSQAASTILATQRGFSTEHLNGLCYAVMVCNQPFYRPDKYFQYYYPNGVPTLRAVMRTAKVYDPRDTSQDWSLPNTWKYSANPALVVLDYLTYTKLDADGRAIPRGMALPKTRMNIPSFKEFANLCDQLVGTKFSLNPVDGSIINSPRNEARYECHGAYQMDEQPTEVLNRILATCDGTLYTLADGTVGIRGGQWIAPTVVINDDMILSCDLSQGNGKFEKFNHLKISYTATNMDYQVVEATPLEEFDDEDENGVLTEELHLPYVQSNSQARRLAKISMAKGNPQWHYNSLVCTFAAINALGEEFVHVTHALPGIDDDFIVLGFKIMLENMTVELQLASIDASAYEWDAATEDVEPPSPQG
jgi:hypothetical protein